MFLNESFQLDHIQVSQPYVSFEATQIILSEINFQVSLNKEEQP